MANKMLAIAAYPCGFTGELVDMEEPSLLQRFTFSENASSAPVHEPFLYRNSGFSQAARELRKDEELAALAALPSSSSSVSKHRISWQEVDFQRMSIIPCKEELLGKLKSQTELPKNKVQGQKYINISEYLTTHFLLLREDCMQNLCQGVQALLQNRWPPDRLDLQVYKDTRLECMRCGKFGLEYLVSFRQNRYTTHDMGALKRLIEGSLVCISDDGFQSIVWGIISSQRKVSIASDCVQLRCIGDGKLDYDRSYTMLECPPAFFEAYCHVLTNLQKSEMTHLPFAEHLISLKPEVEAPEYLIRTEGEQVEYDLSCVFPEMEKDLEPCVFPVLQEWPQWQSTLDPSQIEAVKHGITKRLALIQGPPGTGKTFVGKIIVNILLNNLWERARTPPVWEEGWDSHEPKRIKLNNQELVEGPLLILCYTNHALDQFLEGIYEFEQNIIRFGGRSTSSKLADCSVKERAKKERRGILRSVWSRHRTICRTSDKLQMDISRCHALLHLDCATYEPLCEVATQDQVENLFFAGPNPKTLQLWLQGLDKQSALQQLQEDKRAHGNPPEKTEATLDASRAPHSSLAIVLHEELPEELNFEEPYVWMLGVSARRALHCEWLSRIKGFAERKLSNLTRQYQDLCSSRTRTDEAIQLFTLKGARVIGMTTTAAARCHNILLQLKPKVVIVEEAAEILEAHVIACLTPFTQHLILIGDHLQLRPSVAVNKLATDCYLDVSLFERLVFGGVEHVTLNYQRRMRPGISRLLHSLYPELKDHISVYGRQNVEGLCNNVFFLDHRCQEQHVLESRSKFNTEESLFVVELYLYILKQGSYRTSDVTILTMYRAQMQCIKNVLQERVENVHSLPTRVADALSDSPPLVTCVDDYQGEESNIVILSLVRNVSAEKDTESIGFLENSNRVCVALSRARNGLYIFGNAELLSFKSKLWYAVLEDLKQFKSVGRFFTLSCPNHFLTETHIHEAKDFGKVIDGGCGKKCDFELDCGHSCPRSCHPGDHKQVSCPQRCGRLLQCAHRCMQKCHGKANCAPCVQKVPIKIARCRHRTLRPCSSPAFQCEEPCAAMLACGHKCTRKCGQECTRWCIRKVDKELPCGHITSIPCFKPANKSYCKELCGQSLEPVCKHRCKGNCTACRQKKQHHQCSQPCEKVLPCGHQCKSLCYEVCPPCTRPCECACRHRRCHKKCGDLCQPCEEPCEWNCEHFQCGQKCHQVCNRPRCNEVCPKVLKCGHECIGLCGEPCPIRCRICHPNIVEVCSQLPLKEMEASTRFVELSDCGHLGEYNTLDAMVDMDETAHGEATSRGWPKFCPKCKTPIRRTIRYRSVINSLLMKLQDSKKLIIDQHFWSDTRCFVDEI